MARALMVSVPPGGPSAPRAGGSAATGAWVDGPAIGAGEAVAGGAGTVADGAGACVEGRASTAGVGSRGASTRVSTGGGVGGGGVGSGRRVGGGFRPGGAAGRAAGGLTVTGSSTTWTLTGRGAAGGVDGCRRSRRNPICDRAVTRRASGSSQGS